MSAGEKDEIWQLLQAVYAARVELGYVPADQIHVERNELQLDDYQSSIGNHSYLEQVHLWEVQPGQGEPLRQALIALPALLDELHKRVAVEYAQAETPTPTDADRLDFLEAQARKSSTGISLDWVPSVDGEASGFRFMRRFHIGEPKTSVRAAIDAHIVEERGW